MDNVSRGVNSKKELKLKIRNTVTEMKNTSDRPITGLEMAEERISELKNMTMEYSKNKSKEEKSRKK